jgi:hypothetical protein
MPTFDPRFNRYWGPMGPWPAGRPVYPTQPGQPTFGPSVPQGPQQAPQMPQGAPMQGMPQQAQGAPQIPPWLLQRMMRGGR